MTSLLKSKALKKTAFNSSFVPLKVDPLNRQARGEFVMKSCRCFVLSWCAAAVCCSWPLRADGFLISGCSSSIRGRWAAMQQGYCEGQLSCLRAASSSSRSWLGGGRRLPHGSLRPSTGRLSFTTSDAWNTSRIRVEGVSVSRRRPAAAA